MWFTGDRTSRTRALISTVCFLENDKSSSRNSVPIRVIASSILSSEVSQAARRNAAPLPVSPVGFHSYARIRARVTKFLPRRRLTCIITESTFDCCGISQNFPALSAYVAADDQSGSDALASRRNRTSGLAPNYRICSFSRRHGTLYFLVRKPSTRTRCLSLRDNVRRSFEFSVLFSLFSYFYD